jgi:hypothetical protein
MELMQFSDINGILKKLDEIYEYYIKMPEQPALLINAQTADCQVTGCQDD